MSTLTKKVIIRIGDKEYKGDEREEYSFLNIALSQQLLSPNELRFTIQTKELKICENEQLFPTPRDIMGEKVYCEIETNRYDNNDILEDETESIKFNGRIFNVNVYFSSGTFSEQLIDVIAYSNDYLLTDHPHCFSYENNDLKKIVTATLNPHDIKNEINPRTKGSIPYTVQYNETNYQFLTRLAQRYGEWMYHDGEKWVFGEIKKKAKIVLLSRNDISNYQFHTGMLHHKVKHAHYNYLKCENSVKSNADYPNLTAPGCHKLTDTAKVEADKWFKKETFQHLQCSNPEDNDIDEQEVSVKAQLFGEKTHQTVCSGSSVRSDLTIGSVIEIQDHSFSDDRSDKKIAHEDLMIIGIVHTTETSGYYSNSFTAVSAKCDYPPYFQSDVFPRSSAQRAKVMENIDPEKMGRIRVQFLWQEEQDPNLITPWIRIAQPHGGKYKGFNFVPEIDEEVMVDFENGNAEKPYVVGTLWPGTQKPKDIRDDNSLKYIRTREGHTLQFVDNKEGGGIVLYDTTMPTGGGWCNYLVLLSKEEKLIRLESIGNIEIIAKGNIIMQAGENIESTAGNDIIDKAKNDINMKADNDKKVDVANNLKVTVGSAKSVSAGSISEDAGGEMKLTSGTHSQEAKGTMDLKAGGTLTAKGAVVKIN